MDWDEWQKRWDAQQESYLPDREERYAAMLDAVAVAAGDAPRVVDLAGGTGSITRRVLARFPRASSVVVDLDPALLAIAAGTFDGDARVRVCAADLSDPAWTGTLGEPPASFDAVLTATALHWLPSVRVAALYTEALRLLRPGGILANADHMPDDGLGAFGERLGAERAARRDARRETTGAWDWDRWWEELAGEPEMAGLVAERNRIFHPADGTSHTESEEPSSWHLAAMRAAGSAEVGLLWRGFDDALAVAVAPGTAGTGR